MEDEAPNNLRAWRKTRRPGFDPMTQQELADAVGTAKSVISDLERGVVQLSDKWLRRLAPALHTTPGYILDHDPNNIDNDVLEAFREVPEEARPQALAVLRALARTGTE